MRIAVKQEYFDAIKSGAKTLEYRLRTPYWTKRLMDNPPKRFVITAGYPKSGDESRELHFEWSGVFGVEIEHEHFGPGVHAVYAIALDRSIGKG